VIFLKKFNTLNPSTQENDTNINAMTDKMKTFIGKLCLEVIKLGRLEYVFSFEQFRGGKQCGNK
jgi:hypothetical protein